MYQREIEVIDLSTHFWLIEIIIVVHSTVFIRENDDKIYHYGTSDCLETVFNDLNICNRLIFENVTYYENCNHKFLPQNINEVRI